MSAASRIAGGRVPCVESAAVPISDIPTDIPAGAPMALPRAQGLTLAVDGSSAAPARDLARRPTTGSPAPHAARLQGSLGGRGAVSPGHGRRSGSRFSIRLSGARPDFKDQDTASPGQARGGPPPPRRPAVPAGFRHVN